MTDANPGTTSTPARPLGLWFALALICLALAYKAVAADLLDPDCYLHLLTAKQLLAEGIGPTPDRVAFTGGQTWSPYPWLAELAMLAVWNAGGHAAAAVAYAAMAVALLVLVAAAALHVRRADDGAQPPAMAVAVVTGVAALLAGPFLSFRPATLALTLLALVMAVLVRDRSRGQRTRAVWAVVPVTLLLANVHPFAVVVPVWAGALAAGAAWARWRGPTHERPEAARQMRRYVLLAAACAVAAVATPMLPGMLRTVSGYQLDDPVVKYRLVAEFRPFYEGPANLARLAVVVALFAAALANRRATRAGDWLVALVGVVFVVRFARFWPVLAIAAAPVWALGLSRLRDDVLRQRPIAIGLGAGAAALAVAVVVSAVGVARMSLDEWMDRRDRSGGRGYPVAAKNFVRANVVPVSGRLVNHYDWGGHLAWELGDRFKLFVTGTTPAFPTRFWEVVGLGPKEARHQLVVDANADASILPPNDKTFRPSLVRLGWRAVYRDAKAEVMVPPDRTTAEPTTGPAGAVKLTNR